MAEALGLAASVIAVVDITAKVTGASIKLVSLWKKIKNVPDALLEKSERLKDFEDFLVETESQLANSPLPKQAWNSALLQKYVARTRTVLAELQEMVDRLHFQVTNPRKYKRKFASTEAFLRKEDLKVLDSKLNVALELFRMAREQYLTSLISYSVMIQQEQRQGSGTKLIETPHAKADSDQEAQNTLNDCRENSNRAAVSTIPVISKFSHTPTVVGRLGLSWRSGVGFQMHAQPPKWLVGAVYSILAQKSLWGWQVSLRAYEVVEKFDQELYFKLIREDASVVLKHLDDRKMSPFVRNKHGTTLLEHAFRFGNLKVVKTLLECGLVAFVLENRAGTSYPWVLSVLQTVELHSQQNIWNASAALIELSKYGLSDVLEDPEVFDICLQLGKLGSGFQILLNYTGHRRYQSFPFEKRLQHFRETVDIGEQSFSEELHLLLPEIENLTTEILWSSRMAGRFSLFGSLAVEIVRQVMVKQPNMNETETETTKEARLYGLLTACLKLDPEGLHHLEENSFHAKARIRLSYHPKIRSQTAFSHLMNVIPRWFRHRPTPEMVKCSSYCQRLQRGLSAWLDVLVSNGIDLLDYGRKERDLHEKGLTAIYKQWFCVFEAPMPFCDTLFDDTLLRLSLVGITFGKSKDEWKFWWVSEYEDYAGDFWGMVHEKQFELEIPGRWKDEDDITVVNPDLQEFCRARDWAEEEPLPLIWSEYRKIQAPV